MKRGVLLLILLMYILMVKGQVQRDYMHPITSSPTMTEMARYGNNPVSLSSGTLNVSVPITTLNCGELSVPISLSYNASGIRVHQIASNVGLGWVLNAGGIINCEIIGQSDMMNCTRLIPDSISLNNKVAPDMSSLITIANGPVFNGDTILMGSYVDSQPDMFTFNFLGNSGNFVLDKDFKPYIMNDTRQFEIIPNRENNTFTFIDNKGVIYEFKEYEKTKLIRISKTYSADSISIHGLKDPVSTKTVINGYFLTRIISPNGKHFISFRYSPEIVIYNSPWTASFLSDGQSTSTDLNSLSYNQITNQTHRLSSIYTSEGYALSFLYNHLRKDIKGDCYSLTEIVLEDSNQKKLNSWILNQDYFEADIKSLRSPELNKRLRLNYVLNVAENSFYRFGYNNDINFKVPHRNIIGGVDIFGYFNGSPCSENKYQFLFKNAVYDTSMLPTQFLPSKTAKDYFICVDLSPNFISEGKSNQYVNQSYSDTYSLNKIYYPTGGYTTFKYENNRSSYGYSGHWGGLRISKVSNYSDSDSLISYKDYQYGMGAVDSKPCLVSRKVSLDFDKQPPKNKNYTFLSFISSVPYNSLFAVNGDNIIYTEVTERDDNGFITHYFNSFNEYPSFFDSKIYHILYTSPVEFRSNLYSPINEFSKEYGGKQFVRGLEYKTVFHNIYGRPIKEINSVYSSELVKEIGGVDVINSFSLANSNYNLYLCLYTLKVGRNLLSSQIVNDIQAGIVTKINYDYTDWHEPKQITQTNSNGSIQTTQFRYPSDINTGIYAEMSSKRMFNYPVEEILGVQQKYKAVLNTYRKDNNIIVLDGIYSLNKKGTVKPYDGSSFDPSYVKDFAMIKYDPYGNLNEVKGKDNVSTSYLWSYKGKYAVAEIKNRSFDQLRSDLSDSYINGLLESDFGFDHYPSAPIESLNSLPNVQAKTYTYKPLAGITRINDPNGRSMFFEYDKANRLSCSMISKQEHLTEYQYKNIQSFNMSGYKNNGLSIYSVDKFAVLNNVNFNLSSQSEIIGNCSYSWTLKNSNGAILSTSTQKSFNTDIDEGGTLTVNCLLKEKFLTKDVSYSFNAFHLPLEMSVNIDDEYIFNKYHNSQSFYVITKGGSKKKTFTWTLKEVSGTVISNQSNSDGFFSYDFAENLLLRPLVVTCTVKDEITKELKVVTKNIIVRYPPLKVNFNVDFFVGVNIPEMFSLSLHGGSGKFSYQWNIIDPLNNTILYSSNSEFFEYTQSKMLSSIVLKCLITDLVTNEKKELSEIRVPQYMIKVKNQNSVRSDDGLTDIITADVWSSVPINTLCTSIYTRQGDIPKLEYSSSWGGMYSSLPAGKNRITVKITGQKGMRTDSGVLLKKYSSENVREGDLQIGGFRTF